MLYDSTCRLCRGAIRFIVQRDPRHRFVFAALDSRVGRQVLETDPDLGDASPTELAGSLVLVEPPRDGQPQKLYRRTDAALRIARGLRFPWPIFAIFLLVPRFLRDPFYRCIARYRYRWFGKVTETGLPVPEQPARFVDREEEVSDASPGACSVPRTRPPS